jgi:hypothetical protein
MSSHRCFGCCNGIVLDPYPHTCQFCGGSGWIYDEYDVPYHPVTSNLPTLPENDPYADPE